jgi:hypothetical protein
MKFKRMISGFLIDYLLAVAVSMKSAVSVEA